MNTAAGRSARWLVLALPVTLALVFSPQFSPSFAAPKSALFTAMTFALAALMLVTSPIRIPGKESRRYWIAAVVYVTLILASALLSPLRSVCLHGVVWAVSGPLLCAASSAALAGPSRSRNLRHLAIAISLSAVAVALLTMVQFAGLALLSGFLPLGADRMSLYATLGNPDFVAAFLAAALPAPLTLSKSTSRFPAFWILSAALIAAALLLTGSRAGLLAAAVGLTVFALASGRRTPLLLLALALIAALAVATPLNQRSLAESLRGRVFIWQVSLRDGPAQRPLGSGPGTFVYQYPSQLGRFFAQPGQELLQRFAGHERHAENDFVEAWHDTGWLGLGSLLALLASWLALARRRLSSAGDADRPALSMAIASVAALCCASCFDFPMHRAECWALLWLCLAVPLLPPSASAPPVGVNAAFQFVASTLLVVAGGVFGYAELVGSFQLAQGLNDEKEDRLAAATEDYRQALRWEPASQDANFNLVRTLAKAGDDSSALAQATIAAHFVNEPELFLLRSRILQNQGRYCEAGREIQNALQLFPYAQELRDEAATVPCFADLSQDPPR